MPKFKAKPKSIELTDEQAEELGLTTKSKLLGCGSQACAYLNDDGEVVKFTKDVRDAYASYLVMGLPKRSREWAIPIDDVYRISGDYYAIVAARARPLTGRLASAIDDIYDVARKMDTKEEEEDVFYETLFQDYRMKHDGIDLDALDYVQEAVDGFRNMGLDWADWHSGNWGIYDGRPVVIDLGMSAPLKTLPIKQLNESARERRWLLNEQTILLREAMQAAPSLDF